MDRLINDLVRPTVTKVIYASGPLMSAFESYAEKKNDLIEYITDQLNNGVYKTSVKRVEILDAISGDKKLVNIATLIPDSLSAGGNTSNGGTAMDAMGLKMVSDLVDKMSN